MENSPLEFPGEHPVKVMGKNHDEFRSAMLTAIVEGGHAALRIDERVSRDATYLSLTIHVHADSREALDALYRRLYATGHVLYAL
jgi:uncharacterized protein